jgi:hypothetical protein
MFQSREYGRTYGELVSYAEFTSSHHEVKYGELPTRGGNCPGDFTT